MADKSKLVDAKAVVFMEFQPLSEGAVVKYLLRYLDEKVGKDQDQENGEVPNTRALAHVAKWLRGRPRWVASYLEVYLVRPRDDTHSGTRGSFSEDLAKLVQALDRYLAIHTTEKGKVRRSLVSRKESAYYAIGRAFSHKNDNVKNTLRRAIFKFAVGGQAVICDEDIGALIVVGVAAVRREPHSKIKAILDEPIVVEAGINFYTVEKAALDNMQAQEKSGLGEAFEKVVLAALQAKMTSVLEGENAFEEEDDEIFQQYQMPLRSSYGVLAAQCDQISDTLKWIEKATTAIIEGEVAPFCYPDTAIGPDLIFLMWNHMFTEFLAVIAQAKFKYDIKNQKDALRTITPALLYHENRGNKYCTTSRHLKEEDKTKWEEVRGNLIGDSSKTHGCLRLMVQYPAYKTETAQPGKVADDEIEVKGSGKKGKTQRGWLATVHAENANELFTREALEIFNALKGIEEGEPVRKRQKKVAPKNAAPKTKAPTKKATPKKAPTKKDTKKATKKKAPPPIVRAPAKRKIKEPNRYGHD